MPFTPRFFPTAVLQGPRAKAVQPIEPRSYSGSSEGVPHTDLRSTVFGGSSLGLPDLQAGLDLVNSLRVGPLEHRGGEKAWGEGHPHHRVKFSGTPPPHEASPLDWGAPKSPDSD
ncbi:hypothetical protein Acsp05_29580 [Actinokineospora sp. NBRC 105648]|nr:hypothetical protein Acsp05_29580 [Actinokineospora sp. NBRC 105648]